MDPNEVLRVQNGVLILPHASSQPSIFETQIASPCDRALLGKISTHLPSSIDDLSGVVLALVLDDFAEGILDGGVVAFYEMAIHELHRERGFPLFTVSTKISDVGMQ